MGTCRYIPDKKCPIIVFADMISLGLSLHLNYYFVHERFAINICSREITHIVFVSKGEQAFLLWA